MTDVVAPTIDVAEEHHPTRWKLLWSTLKAQRRNLLIGSAVGLLWTLGKISVPFLVSYSIDRGIEQGEYLWLWVIADRDRRRGRSGRSPRCAASTRSARAALDRDPAARAAVQPHHVAARRLPRPGARRAADEPGIERPHPDPVVRRDDPDHAVEPGDDPRRHRSSCSPPTGSSRSSPSPRCRS